MMQVKCGSANSLNEAVSIFSVALKYKDINTKTKHVHYPTDKDFQLRKISTLDQI